VEDWVYHILDVGIVAASLVEVVADIVSLASDSQDKSSFGIVRALRTARILRLVRLVSGVRLFRGLRVMIMSILHTLKSVMWAMILLILIMYTFAILFAQAYADRIAQEGLDSVGDRSTGMGNLHWYFGGVGRSVLCLFQAITGGVSWEIPLEAIESELGTSLVGLFLLYVSFVYFAVLNVVTGVFCQSAIESAGKDQTMAVEAELANKEEYMRKCHALFKIMDNDDSGSVTVAEFKNHLGDARIQAYFESMDMDTSNAWKLFNLLDSDSEGSVDIEEFVMGCLRLRGQASRIDYEMLCSQMRSIGTHLRVFEEQQMARLGKLEKSIGQMSQQFARSPSRVP